MKLQLFEIYSADWIDENYKIWDSNERKLKRRGTKRVVLKILESVENANRNWYEEVCNLKHFFFKKKVN